MVYRSHTIWYGPLAFLDFDVNSLTSHDVLGGAQILATDQILF
jgi:hypothetical protein